MCLPACCARMLGLFGGPDRPPAPHLAAVAAGAGPASPRPPLRWNRVIDLTHTIDPDFPTWDGAPQFAAVTLATHERAGWFYREWRIHEHTGTHLDAPLHRIAGGPPADRLPAEDLVGPLAVIDVRARAERDPDTELTPADLHVWETRHGRLPDGAIVAMNSGWAAHARSPRFRGADPGGRLHFPGFHPDAVRFLLGERAVRGLIVDTLSLDHGPSEEFPTHTLWLGAGRWGIECAAGLDGVPPSGAVVVVGAPKVAGASGGPSRVLALV